MPDSAILDNEDIYIINKLEKEMGCTAFINLINSDNIFRLKFSLSKDNRNLNDLNEYSGNSFFDVFGFGNTYKTFLIY